MKRSTGRAHQMPKAIASPEDGVAAGFQREAVTLYQLVTYRLHQARSMCDRPRLVSVIVGTAANAVTDAEATVSGEGILLKACKLSAVGACKAFVQVAGASCVVASRDRI